MIVLQIIAIVVVTFLLEFVYEKIRRKPLDENREYMEASMNDGVQTTLRMVFFGFVSICLVLVLTSFVQGT